MIARPTGRGMAQFARFALLIYVAGCALALTAAPATASGGESARAVLAYGAALLVFLAAPASRRSDLAAAVAFVAAAAELVHAFANHTVDTAVARHVGADAAGAAAAYLPGAVERVRHAMRRSPWRAVSGGGDRRRRAHLQQLALRPRQAHG